jgi:hypothetical protein
MTRPMPDSLRPAGALTPDEAACLAAVRALHPRVQVYRIGAGWPEGSPAPGTLFFVVPTKRAD